MNVSIREFAITRIKEGLAKLVDGCSVRFLQMYPEGVENIPDDKLDWALTQIENSLKKPHLLREPGGEGEE